MIPLDCVAGDSLVVVATRYLHAEGVSHAHLYLYKEDGTLLRQLTRFEKGQDHDPLFSPDGQEIVFVRTSDSKAGKNVVEASSKEPASLEYWRVATRGGDLQRLAAPPEWYRAATNAGFFEYWGGKKSADEPPRYGEPNKGWTKNFQPWPDAKDRPPFSFESPDGKYRLVLHLGNEDWEENGPGNGKLYEFKNLKTGKSWRLGDLPGFLGLTALLHESSDPQTLFLQQGDLNVVFFSLHMGSSFGEWCIALNLSQPSLHFLPGNDVPFPSKRVGAVGGNAIPIPLPGESCFLVKGGKRYEPIPGSKKLANISYLARFDASLKDTPYVRLHTAPQFYGASLFRPGKSPEVLKIGQNL